MAVRKKLNHDDKTREKIQTSQLINRLKDHIFGEIALEQTQLRAIEILLKKTLPDLQAIEHSGEIEGGHAVISEKPMTTGEWEKRYAASLEPSTGASTSIN